MSEARVANGSQTEQGQRNQAGEELALSAEFEREYARMMEKAVETSRGERKRRLLEKHGHAEKMLAARVLWPVLGSLDGVHPEYELRDLRTGNRFADYAYIPSRSLALLIEVDGFGPHWRDISRWKFDDDLERQNLLLIDGWRMLRFSYDGAMEKSRRCQQTLMLAFAKWGIIGVGPTKDIRLGVHERAILHFGQSYGGEKLTPAIIAAEVGMHYRTAMNYMKSLEEKGLLSPILSPKGRRLGYTLSYPGLDGQIDH